MRRILVVGATPPPIHGVSVVIQQLLASDVAKQYRLLHLDIADRRGLENLGRLDLQNVRLGLRHGCQFVWRMLRARPDAVYLVLGQNRWAFLRDLLFILPTLMLGARLIVHLQGGAMIPFMRETDPLTRRVSGWVLRRSARVLVLGTRFADELRQAVPDARVDVVPNAVADPGSFERRVPALPLRVAYLGSLMPSKGFPELLKAAELLAGQPIHFTLAGEPVNEAARRAVEEAVARAPDRITHRGIVWGEAKRQYLRDADVVVLPTYYRDEGQPFVLLEAMAAGRAIVATDWAAIGETIRHEREGLLIQPRDAHALAVALERLLRDPQLRMDLGNAARERFLERYTLAAWTGRMIAAFEAALDGEPQFVAAGAAAGARS